MPLGKRCDCGDAKYAGLEVPFDCDLVTSLNESASCGFDFLLTPLVDPNYRRPSDETLPPTSPPPPPYTRPDVILSSAAWSSQVLGKISPWIDPDASDERLRLESERTLKQELGWAAHLSLQAVVLPTPRCPPAAVNFARILSQSLSSLSHMALWLRIPLQSAAAEKSEIDAAAIIAQGGTDASAAPEEADGWEWWHQVRCLCESHKLLGVVLDVGESLPGRESWERWLAEPLKAVVLPTRVFMTNKRGYPTLPKAHQELLSALFMRNIQVILTGDQCHNLDPTPKEAEGKVIETNPGANHPMRTYWEYLSYLFRKMDGLSEQEMSELRYRDYLQAPLQPLQDNLESQTYETFERDSKKYTTYQEAVYRALMDRPPSPGMEEEPIVLMVVGAGRGPLVRASFQAAEKANRKLRVYAVEKNPNAIVTLQNLIISQRWEGKVTLVHKDMRVWEPPEKADIVVSELLGSFGDNELSPECLDGAQRFLKPDGISIPEDYTSYLAPITSHKLYTDVKAYDDLEHFETPYVVKLHNIHTLAPSQEVFTFVHPNRDEVIDNTRYKKMVFKRAEDAPGTVMHGFAGYFDSKLYGDVRLSTHPPTHTPNMFSWFPIYFPIRKPIHVPPGGTIEVHMWRCVAAHKVWYEWAVVSPELSPIHNVNGRSYYVGL